ncbi:MAG: hypothetical protein ACMUIA_01130 [bacterium]
MSKHDRRWSFWLLLFLAGTLSQCLRPALVEPEVMRPKIAIVPFENLSGQYGASEEVMKVLWEVIHKDVAVVPLSHVEKVLADSRIRHTGFLTTEEVKMIGRDLRVDALLTGLIETYRRDPFPQVSFFCMLFSTRGEAPLLWSKNFCGLGKQQVYLLRRGDHTHWSPLIESIAEDLLRSLPNNMKNNEAGQGEQESDG